MLRSPQIGQTMNDDLAACLLLMVEQTIDIHCVHPPSRGPHPEGHSRRRKHRISHFFMPQRQIAQKISSGGSKSCRRQSWRGWCLQPWQVRGQLLSLECRIRDKWHVTSWMFQFNRSWGWTLCSAGSMVGSFFVCSLSLPQSGLREKKSPRKTGCPKHLGFAFSPEIWHSWCSVQAVADLMGWSGISLLGFYGSPRQVESVSAVCHIYNHVCHFTACVLLQALGHAGFPCWALNLQKNWIFAIFGDPILSRVALLQHRDLVGVGTRKHAPHTTNCKN